jgi:hypothetical protein
MKPTREHLWDFLATLAIGVALGVLAWLGMAL